MNEYINKLVVNNKQSSRLTDAVLWCLELWCDRQGETTWLTGARSPGPTIIKHCVRSNWNINSYQDEWNNKILDRHTGNKTDTHTVIDRERQKHRGAMTDIHTKRYGRLFQWKIWTGQQYYKNTHKHKWSNHFLYFWKLKNVFHARQHSVAPTTSWHCRTLPGIPWTNIHYCVYAWFLTPNKSLPCFAAALTLSVTSKHSWSIVIFPLCCVSSLST